MKLKDANDAANKVFRACVDFDKSTPERLALVTEYLAGLTPEMLRRVTTLQEGILLKTKFLPTVADFHALVVELEAKDNQFKPAHTSYVKFDPVTGEIEDNSEEAKAKRKAFVQKLRLDEKFPDGGHSKSPAERILYLGDAPTERELNPKSKHELPKEFPAHLWNTDFIQGNSAA